MYLKTFRGDMTAFEKVFGPPIPTPIVQPARPNPIQVRQPAQPVGQSSPPAGQPAQPVGQPSPPVGQPARPNAIQVRQPVAQPAQPVGQPLQSVGHPAQLIVQPPAAQKVVYVNTRNPYQVIGLPVFPREFWPGVIQQVQAAIA